MRALVLISAASTLVFVLGSFSFAEQVKAGDVTIVVSKDGCGFIDSIRFKGREVVKAAAGFPGGVVRLTAAGDGTADSLFSNAAAATLKSKIDVVKAEGANLVITGSYTDGKVSVPFKREIAAGGANVVTVREEADFTGLDAGCAVAAHSLALPLVVCEDEHLRMMGIGGAARSELFRMDMNDEKHRGQSISAPRAHQPYWDIAGVEQLPGAYHGWKANHADTPAYPIECGDGAPGWLDYSELDWGITAKVASAAESAPWSMRVDARKGIFTISPRPASQPAVSGKTYGKRTFEVQLMVHEKSWPATVPCELDFELYRQLLDFLNAGKGYNNLSYCCQNLGISTQDAARTPEQMKDIYTRVIFKERMQPSVLMRPLYRGDGWRMSGIFQAVMGKAAPKNQPIEKWEEDMKLFWETIRKSGLPKPKE